MNTVKRIIARKYAHAFTHSFASLLNQDVLVKLKKLIGESKGYTALTSLLKLSTVQQARKQRGFETIISDYQLPQEFAWLLSLLISHKRPDLWLLVLKEIFMISTQEQFIEPTRISSSHELTQEQKNKLVAALEKKSNTTIIPDFIVDPSLIQGIRVLSSHFYFEHSFKKYITDIKNSIHI